MSNGDGMMNDFGEYECLGEVARGSTGIVWQARHRELDRVVAVKELSPELRHRPGFLEGFRSEARHLAGLQDPHVIRLFDYVEEPDRAWMAEEWVDGVRLDHLARSVGRFTPEQALGVLRGVLSGLAAAHAIGLVHGDVSPANVLVDHAGAAKLVDFGLAAPAGSASRPDLLGTPAYLSPEAIAGTGRSPRSDVYSAAAVLVELLTGAPPYAGGSVASVLQRHVDAPVPDLADLDAPLRGLLRRALSKDAAARPPDAAAFLTELELVAAEQHGAAWLGRSSVAGAATALLAAGVGGATGGMMAGAVMGGAGVVASSTASGAGAVLTTAAVSTGSASGAGGTVAAAAGASSSVTSGGASAVGEHLGSAVVKSGSRKLLYLAGGGTTAVATAVVAAVVLTASPPLDVAGRYQLTGRTISSEFSTPKAGDPLPASTWTIPKCRTNSCSGTITSSSGSTISFAFNGQVLTASVEDDFTEPCPGGGVANDHSRYDITLRTSTTSGHPGSFTGEMRQTVAAIKVPAGCVQGPPKHVTTAITLTRAS